MTLASGPSQSEQAVKSALESLRRRAEAILKARPAYKELVDFYLTVFTCQVEAWPALRVNPQPVEPDKVRRCLTEGVSLLSRFDPGIELESLLTLWTEMKAVFARGNDVLRQAVEKIESAEESGAFKPGAYLLGQRPDRPELVADAAGKLEIEEQLLATLTRAVTYPHWQFVAQTWLPADRLDEWRRTPCPTCGGAPALGELHSDPSEDVGIKGGVRLYLHCPFCGARWTVPPMKCLVCASTKSGDAKYFFTSDEPELRIDFCASCHHYLKVVDADKIDGPVHVALELLAASHLDTLAQEKDLTPLEMHDFAGDIR